MLANWVLNPQLEDLAPGPPAPTSGWSQGRGGRIAKEESLQPVH